MNVPSLPAEPIVLPLLPQVMPAAPEAPLHPPTIVHLNHDYDPWIRTALWAIVLLLFLIWGAEHGWTQAAAVNPAGLYQWNGTKWVPVNSTNPLPITGSISALNPCASATGGAVPADSCYAGLNVAGNLVGQTGVNPAGSIFAAQVDLTSINGVAFGSPSNYGTSPGAVEVQGVNAFVTNTVPVTGTFFQATQPVSCANAATCPVTATIAASQTIAVTQATAASLNATVVPGGSAIFEVSPTTAANTKTNPFFAAPTDGTNVITAAISALGTAPTGTEVQATNSVALPFTGSGAAVSPCNILTTASTNATNCKNAAGNFYGFDVYNTTTTVYYLRLYNTSSAPTCSSATGFIRTVPVPPGAASGLVAGIVNNQTFPTNYSTGISYCVTGGSGSTDNTNAAAGIFGEIRYE